ncbi:SDA1 domain containing protein Mys45A isoform X2 [Rhodnius prolixus]|uniref:SDA1 domain containing protein Mys45A isoform X2 n=1 Tax=Rhodnius prolixus TaxID=13249 RepID=UPI003D1882C6
MIRRKNNQLPENLPQLQNLIKRDPLSYKDEFIQQKRHYESLLSLFELHPDEYNKSLVDLVMFMAQVSSCYPDSLKDFPQELVNILGTHNTVLHAEMRMAFCRALILLRNRNLLAPMDLLTLFFLLLRSHDKALRQYLEDHIISDIKNMNAKQKNMKLNGSLQNFMYNMLNDSNKKAVKMSLNIMVELYKKNVWRDAKTVNVIATAMFSKVTKIMVTALRFFLSSDESKDDSEDSDSDDNTPSARDVIMANKFNKKTRKREKHLKKVKNVISKSKKKKKKRTTLDNNFSALHLIHDPQGIAEKLFKQIETRNEKFEVKVLTLDVISRLIGLHQLILLNFYPFIQRFLQPHQKEVTKLLLFVAQASHDLVPPDVLEPILRTLVNNFVTERNTSDVMAIGLNAVKELCAKCPLAMNEDLLRDLVQYKNYRERSVNMAAKSLIHLYRTSLPELLHKRDRGKPTESTIELKVKNFGEIDVKDYIPGAEVLVQEKEKDKAGENSDSENDDEEWIDDSESEEEIELSGNDSDKVNEEDLDTSTNESNRSRTISENDKVSEKKTEKKNPQEILIEKKKLASTVSTTKILTDEDFHKIEAAQLAKEVYALKHRGVKRPAEEEAERGELITLADIENIYKKRKQSKEDRIQSVRKGQEGREKFGYKVGRQNPFASTTNREKRKTKNFMMVRHKARSKVKRSFKDKQLALRNYLIKQKKMR